jgi:hypothetical protein
VRAQDQAAPDVEGEPARLSKRNQGGPAQIQEPTYSHRKGPLLVVLESPVGPPPLQG